MPQHHNRRAACVLALALTTLIFAQNASFTWTLLRAAQSLQSLLTYAPPVEIAVGASPPAQPWYYVESRSNSTAPRLLIASPPSPTPSSHPPPPPTPHAGAHSRSKFVSFVATASECFHSYPAAAEAEAALAQGGIGTLIARTVSSAARWRNRSANLAARSQCLARMQGQAANPSLPQGSLLSPLTLQAGEPSAHAMYTIEWIERLHRSSSAAASSANPRHASRRVYQRAAVQWNACTGDASSQAAHQPSYYVETQRPDHEQQVGRAAQSLGMCDAGPLARRLASIQRLRAPSATALPAPLPAVLRPIDLLWINPRRDEGTGDEASGPAVQIAPSALVNSIEGLPEVIALYFFEYLCSAIAQLALLTTHANVLPFLTASRTEECAARARDDLPCPRPRAPPAHLRVHVAQLSVPFGAAAWPQWRLGGSQGRSCRLEVERDG